MKLEKEFGIILKDIRKSRGITQEKLAYDCQLDRTYISLLERGLRQPTISTLFKLSNALDISSVDFIKRLEEKYENS